MNPDDQPAERSPSDDYFVALYQELHRLAELKLHRLGGDLSMGTTTLLHEAYLDLAGRDAVRFPDRARFLDYAARAMRSIVIDYARRGLTKKRGGGEFEITLSEAVGSAVSDRRADAGDLERLSGALDELAELEPALARLVDLHFFCGYSLVEIARFREVSDRTVQRDWRKARLLLQHALIDLT